VDFPNVDRFIGAIVSSGKASLRELRENYTLEEAHDLSEIVLTERFNEWQACEKAKGK
jgi:hypothetical protein